MQLQRGGNRSSHLRPQCDDVALLHLHRVGQQNDVGVGRRINPQRSPGEAGMPERADRQQLAAIRRERASRCPNPVRAPSVRFGGCCGVVIFSTISRRPAPARRRSAWPAQTSQCHRRSRTARHGRQLRPSGRAVGSCTTPRNICPVVSSRSVGAMRGDHVGGGRNRVDAHSQRTEDDRSAHTDPAASR